MSPLVIAANLSSRWARAALLLPPALAFFLVAGAISFSSPASAGGVHFDPDSPAGKEYALPLPEARNEAAGGVGSRHDPTPPLYGVGISGPGSGAAGSSTGPRGTGQEGGPAKRPGAGTNEDNGSAPRSSRSTPTAVLTDSADYPLGKGLWILLGILLLATALGLILRRLPTKPPLA
jgi:hypothetical protein